MVSRECPTNPREASGLDPEAVHQIYNKLRQFGENGQISVDRSGRLNTYQRVD